MPSHAAADLRQSVRARLLGVPAITDILSGVYEQAPAKTAFPYLTMADARVRSWSTKSFDGLEVELILSTWFDVNRFAPLFDVHSHIKMALHKSDLALEAHHLPVFFLEEERFVVDRRRSARVGQLRYRALTHPLEAAA